MNLMFFPSKQTSVGATGLPPKRKGGVRLGRVDRGGEKMESPPRLGLGIIHIVPLRKRTDLTTRVWVQSLGTILERY